MKKIISLLLLALYFTTTMGVNIGPHNCKNKVAGNTFKFSDDTAGMQYKPDCCTGGHKYFKFKAGHKIPSQSFSYIFNAAKGFNAATAIPYKKQIYTAAIPLPSGTKPINLYKFYCVFRL